MTFQTFLNLRGPKVFKNDDCSDFLCFEAPNHLKITTLLTFNGFGTLRPLGLAEAPHDLKSKTSIKTNDFSEFFDLGGPKPFQNNDFCNFLLWRPSPTPGAEKFQNH